MDLTRRQSLALLGATLSNAAQKPLIAQWERIAMSTDGIVGVAALHIGSGRSIAIHGNEQFPLASVCKLPIAIHILAMVDEGKFALNDELEIPIYDVVPGVSEVAERWATQKRFPLDELLQLMVAKSDNSAVQTLFRMGGGADGMSARLRQWRIDGIRVDRSERDCAFAAAGVVNVPPVSQWTPGMYQELTAKIAPNVRLAAMRRFVADPRDTATPDGTVRLLQMAVRGELLSARLTMRLMDILKATSTGSARIKGLLPPEVVVAHKTGTTGTILKLNGSTNDAGVIMTPEAGPLAIAVFVKGSTRDQAARERVIARIARAAFDSAATLA